MTHAIIDIPSQAILRKAVASRLVEEALLDLFSRGKLHGTVHTCIGQEMSGAVVTEFLREGDTIFSKHRCHGHFISRNDDVEGLIAELMGRSSGVSGGLGGSQHLYKDGFFSNGIQGGIVPVAAGLAMGHKIKGQGHISVVFIGDGTLGEGAVYEAFNIAAKWSLPMLVVLEDNKYSQSTAQSETLSGAICDRATAFGIETAVGSTWEWRELYETVGDLRTAMRMDGKPRFLQIETYRLKAHSKGDDTRPRDVVEPYEKRDPVTLFLSDLSSEEADWVSGLRDRIRRAEQMAEQAPPATLLPIEDGSQRDVNWAAASGVDRTRLVTALSSTFGGLMHDHEDIIMLGEDILSPYGGAFKATNNLSFDFPTRVYNTPISEAGIVGIGSGLALAGYRPIVEIMFGDFIGLAFDQIVNHAAKFRQMYNGQVSSNLIVRTPMGGGRGYGPTHSQTLDKHFFGVPGLTVVAINGFVEPREIYGPLMAWDSGPALVIENKLLYGAYVPLAVPDGFSLLRSDEEFPSVWLKPHSSTCDIVLIGYGGLGDALVRAADTLFDEHDIVAHVFVPTKIYPFAIKPHLRAVGGAPRILVVEEGQGFAGFGAEVISQLAECDALAHVKVRRLFPPAHCIPSSGPLEKTLLPSSDLVVDVVTAWMST